MGTTAAMLRAEGKAHMLAKLLASRFPPLAPAVLDRIADASEENLDAWFDKALSAKSLEAVWRP